MDQRLQERLDKIAALMERGVGGEKTNASEIFTKLQEKYTPSEIKFKYQRYTIKFSSVKYEKQLALSLLMKVTDETSMSYWRAKRSRTSVTVELTESEYTEFLYLFDKYKELLKVNMDRFFNMFTESNQLPQIKV